MNDESGTNDKQGSNCLKCLYGEISKTYFIIETHLFLYPKHENLIENVGEKTTTYKRRSQWAQDLHLENFSYFVQNTDVI